MKTLLYIFWIILTTSVPGKCDNRIHCHSSYHKGDMLADVDGGEQSKTGEDGSKNSAPNITSECLNYENPKHAEESKSSDIDEPDTRIVGGETVEIKKYPYQVAIFLKDEFQCGGAIIQDKFVLTAAHCFKRAGAKDFYVQAGITSLLDDGQRREAVKVFPHERFDYSSFDYDIGILMVDKPFEFNINVTKIKLPDDGVNLNAGDNLIIAGYGRTTDKGVNYNNDLHAITVALESLEKCKNIYKDITDRQICTTSPAGHGICLGDEGGPLVKDGYIVGISAIIIPCGKGFPDAFTNVAYFLNWIHNIISTN